MQLTDAQLRDAREQRDALRAKILEALAVRPSPIHASATPTGPQGNARRPPGDLTNRIGGRQELLAHLNEDFMPLAKECIEHAQEQSPELAGMLVVGVETVADESLGAVVELVEPAPNNQILNPDLLECIRQTAFSVQLPPPPVGGREKFEISLRIAPTSAPN